MWASIKYQRGSKKNEESREAKMKCVKIPIKAAYMFVNVNINNLKGKNHPWKDLEKNEIEKSKF